MVGSFKETRWDQIFENRDLESRCFRSSYCTRKYSSKGNIAEAWSSSFNNTQDAIKQYNAECDNNILMLMFLSLRYVDSSQVNFSYDIAINKFRNGMVPFWRTIHGERASRNGIPLSNSLKTSLGILQAAD